MAKIPSKSYKRFKKTLRRQNKKLRNKYRTVSVRTSGPFPRSIYVPFKYNDTHLITTTSLAADYIYRLNSIFDPNYTGTGHQPYGRDSYAALYNRYLVYKVTGYIVVTATDTTPIKVTVLFNNDTAAITNPSLAAEMPSSRTYLVTSESPVRIPIRVSPRNVSGVTPVKYRTDDLYGASIGADPAEHILMHIVTSNGSGSSKDVTVNPFLIYHTRLFDPYDLAQS